MIKSEDKRSDIGGFKVYNLKEFLGMDFSNEILMREGLISVSKDEYENTKCEKCGIHSQNGFIAFQKDKKPTSERVTWRHTKNHLSAFYKIKGKKTEKELYWIEKSRCRTKEEQIDWVNQISGKVWGNRYVFTNALKKACIDWGVW